MDGIRGEYKQLARGELSKKELAARAGRQLVSYVRAHLPPSSTTLLPAAVPWVSINA